MKAAAKRCGRWKVYKTNYCYDTHGVLPDRFDDHDVRGNLRVRHAPQPAGDADLGGTDPQFGRYQFRGIQPFSVSGSVGGLLLPRATRPKNCAATNSS